MAKIKDIPPKRMPDGSIRSESAFFHAHLHTNFSSLDGMVKPEIMAERAFRNGDTAISTTDHGNMGGTVQMYRAAKSRGMQYFPGIEGYLIDPKRDDWEAPVKGADPVARFHFILLALNEDGYKALVQFTTRTHTRPRFNRFPRASINDLAELGINHGENVALLTGCYFGLLQQTLVHEGRERAGKVLDMYSGWFPNTYVELQHHNIYHGGDEGVRSEFSDDDDIVEALVELAEERGLHVIATQDAHYCDQKQKASHALMKRMTYGGGADNEFPGDSFHLASWEWIADHYSQEVWDKCEEGYVALKELNDVSIAPLDNFKPDVPRMPGVKAPKREVRKGCEKALKDYQAESGLRDSQMQKYWDRLDYEMDVINYLGMASYFVIWQKFAEWCREEGIAIEARGSANGSLVCFLLRITQVDPIIWGADFERFLSKDRIKPPDVDMDIEDAERPRAVAYLLSLFEACQIGTWSKLGTKYDEREDTEKGSVLTSYLAGKRAECQYRAKKYITEQIALAEKKGVKPKFRLGDVDDYSRGIFAREYGYIKDIRDIKDEGEYNALREIATMNSVFKSYGVHAGGILLSGERIKIDEYIPKMLVASSDTIVSQFDMDDVEEFGLLKMDILGQATLRTMKIVQQLIDVDDVSSFAWIENNDPEACKILRSGRTETGVFHQEGYTKAKGGKELKVKSTMDAVLMQALFMPGAMDSGQTTHFLRARRDREFRQSVEYVHPIFEKHLKPTYGAYVFQNQVLAILRDMGMEIAEINVFLKVVKSSGAGSKEKNAEKLLKLRKTFDKLWDDLGIPRNEIESTWDALCGFGAYGFNKAHAAGYGIRMYRCAYLKAHYPLEYMTALLQTWAGRDKEKVYIKEARYLGLRMMPPDVNISGASWSIDRKRSAIRKGLVSIPGIGEATANAIEATRLEDGDFESVEDMITRLPGRALSGGKKFMETGEITGTFGKLYHAGAMDSLIEE